MTRGADNLVLLVAIGALAYGAYTLLQPPDDGSADGGDASAGADVTGQGALDGDTVYALAQQTLSDMGITDIDPGMATAIAYIESSFEPGAVRQEPQIGDASYGLMQTLLGTASWLYNTLGYTAYGAPTAASLTDAATSMYFGCAYLHWLRNYGGQTQSDAFVVQAYNEGPGNASKGVTDAAYLGKYSAAVSNLGYA